MLNKFIAVIKAEQLLDDCQPVVNLILAGIIVRVRQWFEIPFGFGTPELDSCSGTRPRAEFGRLSNLTDSSLIPVAVQQRPYDDIPGE